jgi:hypothetical protein
MDPVQVPLWAWGVTVAGLILLVAADLILGGRRAREVRLREAALGTIAVVALAVLFGTALAWTAPPRVPLASSSRAGLPSTASRWTTCLSS